MIIYILKESYQYAYSNDSTFTSNIVDVYLDESLADADCERLNKQDYQYLYCNYSAEVEKHIVKEKA